jgi:Ni2+-binding GTPase involved in maturation of urease and hydrogenase
MPPVLLTVGGFLGAGKTTLIAQAAGILARRGKRVVVVTNDQAPELVDTALIELAGVPAAEVAGACFCCAFNDFAAKTHELIAHHRPDVVLAEPVGSCVDIAATVLRPLAREAGQELHVAPFSVVVDPAALREVSSGGVVPATAYIYRLQLREADLLLLNKCDAEADPAIAEAELAAAAPAAAVLRISAATGAGVGAWLDAVLDAARDGGGKRIDVDYDTYAAGEAALGWLNASVELTGGDWEPILRRLMAAIALPGIAHLKCLLKSGATILVANQVAGRPAAELRRLAGGAPAATAQLTINARIACTPAELRRAVEAAIAGLGVAGRVKGIRAFAPGRPVPVHHLK